MKIIASDNFDREGPGHDDQLIASNVPEHYARRIAKLLNDNDPEGMNGPNFYRAVPDDYKLRRFEP